MFYRNLKFPKIKGRPFFYTNFVQTVDGKVAVLRDGYWPIGSSRDQRILMELRSRADCLIHGSNLYQEFGEITKKSLQRKAFQNLRKNLGKNPTLPYLTGIHNLKKLVKELSKKGYKDILVEGGPTLLGSFLKEDLMDEIFLTIAPRIFGSEEDITKTLVEGYLFPQNATRKLRLLSVKRLESELYLRYRVA